MKITLTPWFDKDTKPVREGVYEVRYAICNYYAYWTGEFWCPSDRTKRRAKKWRGVTSCIQNRAWRGLTGRAE